MSKKYIKNRVYFILATLLVVIGVISIKNCKFVHLFSRSPIENHLSKYFEIKKTPINPDFSSSFKSVKERSKLDFVQTRDFIRYDCENIVRVGGRVSLVEATPDNMTRIDGAWFVCLDRSLKLLANNCTILSFGINHDYTFDVAIKDAYSCRVHSFDPIVEAEFFIQIRQKNANFLNAPVLHIDDNWTFYKLGLSDTNTNELSSLQLGDMLDFASMLKLTNMENKVIDLIKIDIEGNEKSFLRDLNMAYACKYIKQLSFETHANIRFNEMVKLEECFYLFHRDTRFFLTSMSLAWGPIVEFHNPYGFKLDLKPFKNEMNLAEFMFANGELYFVNINFLS
jgi:hypothetical protein